MVLGDGNARRRDKAPGVAGEHKTHFSYGDKHVDEQDLQAAKVKMEQFFKWAYDTLPALAQIEEPQNA